MQVLHAVPVAQENETVKITAFLILQRIKVGRRLAHYTHNSFYRPRHDRNIPAHDHPEQQAHALHA